MSRRPSLPKPPRRLSEVLTAASQPWHLRMLTSMREFVGKVLGVEVQDPPTPGYRRGTLRFDLYLNMGTASVKLFSAGPIDEFRFFQRLGMGDRHDLEFLTRLAPGERGTENFKPFGLFRLEDPGRPLPDLSRSPFWRRIEREYGLHKIPLAKSLIQNKRFTGYDVRIDNRNAGCNVIAAPRSRRAFTTVGKRRFSHQDMLEIIRRELTSEEKVAWIEEAFSARPEPGEILHRYYLDGGKRAFLVVDHWRTGKRLLEAATSAEARRLILESGAFQRQSRRAA